jgi:hypothetical protein
LRRAFAAVPVTGAASIIFVFYLLGQVGTGSLLLYKKIHRYVLRRRGMGDLSQLVPLELWIAGFP